MLQLSKLVSRIFTKITAWKKLQLLNHPTDKTASSTKHTNEIMQRCLLSLLSFTFSKNLT